MHEERLQGNVECYFKHLTISQDILKHIGCIVQVDIKLVFFKCEITFVGSYSYFVGSEWN